MHGKKGHQQGSDIDLAVIVANLLGMAGMGFWFVRRNKDADAYFGAVGCLPWWVVSKCLYRAEKLICDVG